MNDLRVALRARGIATPDAFRERYGVDGGTLTADTVLTLLLLHDHPRAHDRGEWTPIQRDSYVSGCLDALETLKARLERGLMVLSEHSTVAAEVHWFRLATRAMRLIGRLARVSEEADAAFCATPLGRWYAALEWPEPSPAALREEWG